MSEVRGWEFISWGDFYTLARNLSFQIHKSDYHPDIIIAIARGGNPVANILSDYLKVTDMACIQIRHYEASHKENKATIEHPLTVDVTGMNVLLVDDVSDSGDTFNIAITHIMATSRPAVLKTATLHHRSVSNYRPDYYSQEVTDLRWITYPWALMEDIGGYIAKMEPTPESVKEVADTLKRDHAIELPDQILADALRLLNNHR